MNRGQLPTNQLHDINRGALDHASRAPQLMSCNYTVCAYVCVCVCVCYSEIKLQLFPQKSIYPRKQPGYIQGGCCESQGAAA